MAKKRKRGNKELIIILIAFIIVVLSLNIYLFSYLSKIVEIRELEASIIVSDKVGFDLNSSALTFGEVLIGGSSSREIILENDFGFPIEIYVYGRGGIKKFISPFKEKIEENEKKNLKITAKVSEDIAFGKYEGKAVIRIKRLK